MLDEYFCPNCGATLEEQKGFKPTKGVWKCTNCGQELYGDDIYDGNYYKGVMWYCDGCGELLNKQKGFKDKPGKYVCKKCGYENKISITEIKGFGAKSEVIGSFLKETLKGFDSTSKKTINNDSGNDYYSEYDDGDGYDSDEEYDNDSNNDYNSGEEYDDNSADDYDDEYSENEDIEQDDSDDDYDYNEEYDDSTGNYDDEEEYDNDSIDDCDSDNEYEEENYESHSSSFDLNVDNNSSSSLKTKNNKAPGFFESLLNAIKVVLIVAFIIFIGLFSLNIYNKYYNPNTHPGKIKMQNSQSSYKDKDYMIAYREFVDAGFTDVTLEPIKDITLGWFAKEGEIKEVTIDNGGFDAGEWISKDAKIVIKYHAKKD